MKISEYIKFLEEFMAEYGDVNLMRYDWIQGRYVDCTGPVLLSDHEILMSEEQAVFEKFPFMEKLFG